MNDQSILFKSIILPYSSYKFIVNRLISTGEKYSLVLLLVCVKPLSLEPKLFVDPVKLILAKILSPIVELLYATKNDGLELLAYSFREKKQYREPDKNGIPSDTLAIGVVTPIEEGSTLPNIYSAPRKPKVHPNFV